ncbi:hypothetical protein Taro_012049, partial [Colocasia esculenta]|nr:hypothetical protein [Colocasia esculenta]
VGGAPPNLFYIKPVGGEPSPNRFNIKTGWGCSPPTCLILNRLGVLPPNLFNIKPVEGELPPTEMGFSPPPSPVYAGRGGEANPYKRGGTPSSEMGGKNPRKPPPYAEEISPHRKGREAHKPPYAGRPPSLQVPISSLKTLLVGLPKPCKPVPKGEATSPIEAPPSCCASPWRNQSPKAL